MRVTLPARPLLAFGLAVLFLPSCGSPARVLTQSELPTVRNLSVVTLGGERLGLHEFRGKVVLLDFWASWCEPCHDALAAYAELHEQYNSRGFEVVAVSVDEWTRDARKFAEQSPRPFPVAYDANRRLASRFGITLLPSSFLIDQGGRVRHGYEGFDPDLLRALEGHIKALLSEPRAPGSAPAAAAGQRRIDEDSRPSSARCVFPRPLLPHSFRLRPSLTGSGPR